MVKRRRGPPARPSAARHDADKAGVISAVLPAEAVAAEQAGPGPENLADVHATPDHAPSVHEALLETVSPEAIEVAAGEPVSAQTELSEAPEPTQQAAEPPPEEASAPGAADSQESASTQPVLHDFLPEDSGAQVPAANDAHPAAVEQPEPVEAVSPEVVSLDDIAPPAPLEAAVAPEATATVEAATALAAVPETSARSGRASLDMIGEIAEANATFLAFLRNEGSAAVAHWHSLSGAKTPADALRIQVDEMQRAADASLTCFSALARRAGRLASEIGRI